MQEVIATVVENKKIAENVFSLTVETEEKLRVRPGQFAMVGVPGKPLRRPIAVAKACEKQVTVCYQLKGEGTHALSSEVKQGDKLSVLLPLGNGFFAEEGEKNIALVGGGVGVFPLVSVIGEYAGKKNISAYMGFRNREAICMREEMERADRLVIATDDGSEGVHGNAVQAFLADVGGKKPDVVFSCGPLPMLRALKEATKDMGIPVYVSLEERMGCGIGACLVCVCDKTDGKRARVCKDGPVFEIGQVQL